MSAFDDEMRRAARVAADAASQVMREYNSGYWRDEDDITPALAKGVAIELKHIRTGLNWTASVLRHRSGKAAQEQQVGADLLIAIRVETPEVSFSKGLLVQAKRVEPDELLSKKAQDDLKSQCKKMLNISPGGSYVFSYRRDSMRVGSAIRVAGSDSRDLNSILPWTAYRFFLEFFRCPIGDAKITSAMFEDLPVATSLEIAARGELRRMPDRV